MITNDEDGNVSNNLFKYSPLGISLESILKSFDTKDIGNSVAR